MDFINEHIIDKIDFGTIIILFCLMAVVAGFQKLGYIDRMAEMIVKKAGNTDRLVLSLVMICFLLSMFITNDVALIILVPFTIQILQNIDEQERMIKVIVLETIAANIGSMLTPIGNPQNLYLYQFYHMSFGDFMKTVLPYGLMAAVLLVLVLSIDKKKNLTGAREQKGEINLSEKISNQRENKWSKRKYSQTALYFVLFILCILTVFDVISCYITFACVLICIMISDYHLFQKINYSLLVKFILLFLLVGNAADISWIRDKLETVVVGQEFLSGIILSQCLSNVPTAIMLSEFTKNGTELLLGVDIGGLGTLIASMASMISLDYYTKVEDANKSKYIKSFTIYNLLFLCVMIGMRLVITISTNN